MNENLRNTPVDVVKYLDLQGLNALWAKISNTFTRKSDLISSLTEVSENGLITNDGDLFVQKSALTAINERIDDLASGQSVKVDGTTITQDASGTIKTNLILYDNTENHTLCLATPQTNAEGEFDGTVISEWDYSNLYSEAIKNGMIKDVSLVVIPGDESEEDSGQAEGTYLKFEFETSSGDSSPIYVNVSDLIDVYEGSSYIKITDNTVSLDTAQLVTYLKTDEALGITSITTRLDTVEGNITSLTDRISSIEETINSLNITELAENVQDLTGKVNNFEEKLKGVPTVAITESEINALK